MKRTYSKGFHISDMINLMQSLPDYLKDIPFTISTDNRLNWNNRTNLVSTEIEVMLESNCIGYPFNPKSDKPQRDIHAIQIYIRNQGRV